MNQRLENIIAMSAPAIFVLLWSTGFIGTRYALNAAEPLTYLAVRMILVAVLMLGIVAVFRPKWPNAAGIFHSVVAGLLMHGFYLGGVSVAIALSVPVGLSALIPGLQPVLVSTIANRWLGERVTPLQWTGLVLGLIGVVLILRGRPMTGEVGWGWLASGVALISITLGALYQKRYCGNIDWRTGNFFQYAGTSVLFLIGSWFFETGEIDWTFEFIAALFWLAVVLSIGSIGVLYWLLRKRGSAQVASLFYLVPAVTAVMAYVLFSETLDALAIVGMVVCGSAVLLVNTKRS